jgi:hypothetical protein
VPYEPLFGERGFHKQTARDRGPFFTDANGRFVSYDRIKGGDLRCFLGISAAAPNSPPEIEAETCWWRTDHDCTLESAAASSWQYLLECGFRFLDEPLQLTPTQWRERHNLLVRDRRLRTLVVSWPAEWRLNDVVIRSKRCIPDFATISALELHQHLQHQRQIIITPISLADGLELRQAIETHGFSVNIRNA